MVSKMARKKQTRRAAKNKRFQAKKAADKDENKAETKDSKEDVNSEVSVGETATVSSQNSETAAAAGHVENETGPDLKRKREASSDVDSDDEDSKKIKGKEEKRVFNEISIRIERW